MFDHKKKLIIVIPVLLTITVGVITTLSLPIFTLGPERISIYTSEYQATDFTLIDIKVKYYEPDELEVRFYLSGGDGVKDLRFEFICRDTNDDHISSAGSGTMLVEAIGDSVTNSTTISNGDLVKGILIWHDFPSGDQQIKATITLQDIVLETESFFIDLRQS